MQLYTVQAKMSVMFFSVSFVFPVSSRQDRNPPYHWHNMWKPEPQDHCGLQCFLYQMRAKKGKFSLECDTCLKPALLEKVAFELCVKYIMVNNLLKHTPLKEATWLMAVVSFKFVQIKRDFAQIIQKQRICHQLFMHVSWVVVLHCCLYIFAINEEEKSSSACSVQFSCFMSPFCSFPQ